MSYSQPMFLQTQFEMTDTTQNNFTLGFTNIIKDYCDTRETTYNPYIESPSFGIDSNHNAINFQQVEAIPHDYISQYENQTNSNMIDSISEQFFQAMHEEMTPGYLFSPFVKSKELSNIAIEKLEKFAIEINKDIIEQNYLIAYEKSKGYMRVMKTEEEFWLNYSDKEYLKNIITNFYMICNTILENLVEESPKKQIIEILNKLDEYRIMLESHCLAFNQAQIEYKVNKFRQIISIN